MEPFNRAAAETKTRTKVLCLDDEPNVLAGLSLHLRKRYEVLTATNGVDALAMVEEFHPGVVLSDMRMPRMDGTQFLSQVRQMAPDAVRILLTGHADLESAIAVVNEGQVFRFLTKPCQPTTLLATVDAAAEQNRLITCERTLLEQTLNGSIKALTDVVALLDPESFSRGTRVKRLVSSLCEHFEIRERWQVEVASMLNQLGYISVPRETIEKERRGQPLSEPEIRMIRHVPEVAESLLAGIPRLEEVRAILNNLNRPPASPAGNSLHSLTDSTSRGTALLRAALDFDALEAQGNTSVYAIDILRGRKGKYVGDVLDALQTLHGDSHVRNEVHEVGIADLRVGMVLAEDMKLRSGALLVGRGSDITVALLQRLRNFELSRVVQPVRVFTSGSVA